MVTFDSASIYIESCSTLRDKITAIDNIIATLELKALDVAANSDLTEYTLNDGQTQIKCTYRSAESITASINAFEAIKQRYVNRLNGRMVRLVDGKNFIPRRRYGRF